MRKNSPLKSKPLRQAGESVQEELDKLLGEKVEPYYLVPLFLIFLALYEWIRWWQEAPPYPLATSLFAVIALAYCVPKILRIRRRARSLALGRDGERAVGEYLENLRQSGCIVFHDIVADGFNIDHVVLSEKGIFVIETKTFSKPRSGRIHRNGESLTVDGLGDQSNILEQAKGNTRWIAETLNESTGRAYPTMPVIVFPGWFVEGGLGRDVWVINPKALPKLIASEDPRISAENLKLAAFHLARYIRAAK